MGVSAPVALENWRAEASGDYRVLRKLAGADVGSGQFDPARVRRLATTTSAAIDLNLVIDSDQKRTDRWPRLMTARTAAAYCDERSPYSFRRAVGRLWPHPVKVPGKGERWLKEDLDEAIDRATQRPSSVRDAADVL